MCEAIGEARRHRPCLRGTAFGACSSALMVFLRFRCKARRAQLRNECMPGDAGNLRGCIEATPRKSERAARRRQSGRLTAAQSTDADARPQTYTQRSTCRYGPISDIHDMEKRCNMLQDTRTPRRAEPCEAVWRSLDLQSADSHHSRQRLQCVRKGYWDQTATISR